MPTKSQRMALRVSSQEQEEISRLAQSQSAPHREVQRTRILQQYLMSTSFTDIAASLQTPRRIVYKCIDKALEMGIEVALKDMPHGRRTRAIQPEDKAWVARLACNKPKDLGYAAESWTRRSLARYVREHATSEGHPAPAKAAKATIQRILAEQEQQPHRVRYYMARRDPEFEAKMKEVLLVYREGATALGEGLKTAEGRSLYTVSVDEKPGVPALGTTAPDLPPVPGTELDRSVRKLHARAPDWV